MNPYTGHLVNVGDDEAMQRSLNRTGYSMVPDKLQAAAQAELAGNTETYVDLRSRSPLAAWAKKKRKEKAAARSRRINRR